MKYLLLMYADEAKMPQTPEEQQAVAHAWQTVLADMKSSGTWLGNNGLASIADATTVRIREGRTLTSDGPFAETHEQLGGYYLLDCKDLDEAIAWAVRIPTAKYGSVEIRPLNRWSQNS